ncbi:hypothetical protein HMPREF0043_02046, partial [Actinobaculum sp. oral taxon 183 str. F0552]
MRGGFASQDCDRHNSTTYSVSPRRPLRPPADRRRLDDGSRWTWIRMAATTLRHGRLTTLRPRHAAAPRGTREGALARRPA